MNPTIQTKPNPVPTTTPKQFSKTQEMLNKHTNIQDPRKVLANVKSEVMAEREKREALQTKTRQEPTKIQKTKNYGPLQGIVDLIYPKRRKELEQEKKTIGKPDVGRKIEGLTVQDIIAPIEMEIDFNFIQVGEWYFRTIFVSGYPRFVGPNWLSPIINFEHSLRISSFYYPVDSKVILQKLKKKIGEMEATLFTQMEDRKVIDPSLKVALTDAQQLQDAIAEGVEKFFHFGMYITIQSRDKEELEKITKNVISTFAAINVTSKQATLQQEQGLISTQPLGTDRIFITRNMDTTSLATTFPFVTSELTMDHGIMYGINQHNRSLVIFDRFDMENANSVVFAKSGAGKSYFVKLEALRSMMLGTEVIIIDPEKEYKNLCEAVNGAYISFSQDKGDKMNPFELSGLGQEQDELRMKMLALQGFFRIMMGKLNSIELAILDRALILTYREKGITMDPATQKNATYPLIEDLYKVLKGMAEPEARALASRLERYIIGSAAGVFNEKSTVSLDNPFTVFSIRDMPEELRPMAMYLMLDFIWTKIRMDQKRRLLIVDEAWYMMQNEDSGRFLYSIAKRARKYYVGLTTITQDVDDFLQNEMGRAIITNSAIQMLMKQSPTAVERLQGVFNLSDGEKFFLLTADKGQGLFFAGRNHVAIQVVSSQMEHELITSDPKDLEKLAALKGTVDTRTIEELSELYEPPAMQQPIKSGVSNDQGGIEKAIEGRKSRVEQMIEEKLRIEGGTANNVDKTTKDIQNYEQEKRKLYSSLSEQVTDQRDQMNKGRTHITAQGVVGEIEPTEPGQDNKSNNNR